MKPLIPATRQDKARVIDILVTAFDQDPQIQWYIGKGPGRQRRLYTLMEFAFEEGMARNAVFLSEDRNGVSIWRKTTATPFSWPFMWLYVKFTMVFGLKRIKAITAMEDNIKSRYPTSNPFWYLWLLAVAPEGQGKGVSSQLLRPHLHSADKQEVPVYLETSKLRNVSIYQRKGFEVYDEMELDAEVGSQIYFMRREANPVIPSSIQEKVSVVPSAL
ncbi:MAG: GNAT family N-acetyltransferase [Bacteroidota bacterium]